MHAEYLKMFLENLLTALKKDKRTPDSYFDVEESMTNKVFSNNVESPPLSL
jgi:hypothetical protein